MIKDKIFSPFQRFVNTESMGGVLLFCTTLLALFWANSSNSESYNLFWDQLIGFKIGDFSLYKPLLLWVNDGLMGIFFFLIGLEIKREILIGDLNSIKKVSFPLFGALGGMLTPVLLYLILNTSASTESGWGIPMATDIAFSLAILNILGKRVPLSLKLFLTAFAIVDDIGAVIVIAIFYSSSINFLYIGYALIILIFTYYLAYKSFFSKFFSFIVGAIVWFLFLKSGIHPTIAGILLAFSIPVRQKAKTNDFLEKLNEIIDKIKHSKKSTLPILSKEQIEHVDELENWTNKYQSPLQHIEHRLHNWVAYFVLPVFALANAGVSLNNNSDINYTLVSNIVLCLVAGNSIGISLIILLAKKLKLIDIPKDINTYHIISVSFLAGVGFTMAIFIAGLAFSSSPELIDSAKIGILLGSFISALLGYSVLRFNKNSGSQNPL